MVDANKAAMMMVPGQVYRAGRQVIINCTMGGAVTLTLFDGSEVTLTPGPSIFPLDLPVISYDPDETFQGSVYSIL